MIHEAKIIVIDLSQGKTRAEKKALRLRKALHEAEEVGLAARASSASKDPSIRQIALSVMDDVYREIAGDEDSIGLRAEHRVAERAVMKERAEAEKRP